jgi:hypothetical protein
MHPRNIIAKMTATDDKHALSEKEYTDEVAQDAAARGQVATDQYVLRSHADFPERTAPLTRAS